MPLILVAYPSPCPSLLKLQFCMEWKNEKQSNSSHPQDSGVMSKNKSHSSNVVHPKQEPQQDLVFKTTVKEEYNHHCKIYHKTTIKAPLNHKESRVKASLNHQENIVKAPSSHQGSITTAPLNHQNNIVKPPRLSIKHPKSTIEPPRKHC